MINYIMAGNKIVITPAVKAAKGVSAEEQSETTESFVSQVSDVLENKEIAALVPISQGRLVWLPQTGRYNFVFHTKKGMINFQGKILEYYKDGGDFMMTLKILSDGELMQRREFFRFTCRLPIRFVEQEDLGESGEQSETVLDEMKSGVTEDLSGGGLRFFSSEDVPVNARIRCILDLGGDLLFFIAKIIGRDLIKDRQNIFDYRIVYAGILPSDQERIVRYIFNEQRRILKAIR